MTLAEQVYEVAKTLPTNQASEVLDFIYFLKAKIELENSHVLVEERNTIEGILARCNQRVPVRKSY
ncbi:hypothetical protein THII_3023 [Thioploca ingrica]|uniref:Uncharacterized protein n=1 Tax=Thioploca ingrica TaxID=40754 RepID=A0A090APC2_9GAMM|nr:hypothetical protein THII_3023 [Thioploca ingrica]